MATRRKNYQGEAAEAGKKRRRWEYDSAAEENDDDEYEDDEEEEYGGGRDKKRRPGSAFIDDEAVVDSDEEEDEDGDELEDGFIVDGGADGDVDLDDDSREAHHRLRRPVFHGEEDDEEEDIEAFERRIHEKYRRQEVEYDYEEEVTEVEKQALLPSIRDPRLWMVKCSVGREKEVAACLLKKALDSRGPARLQIRSAIALDHIENYVYVEADKEAHVKLAIKGIPHVFAYARIILVPIQEMTDVLSVKGKAPKFSREAWVRLKTGTYKGDLAKVVDVNDVLRKVTLKLIPRIDFQDVAARLEGLKVPKKTTTPPARLMHMDQVKGMDIPVKQGRDLMTGDYFQYIGNLKFKDGFLYKSFSVKSITMDNIQPTFDEIERFRNGGVNVTGLSEFCANRKKGNFQKGDRVIIFRGDLRGLKGLIEKVEEHIVHIKPNEKNGLPQSLAVSDKEICKYFEPGNHVKVVAGAKEGATGTIVSVEGHLVNVVSDTTKELLTVFADYIVRSTEVSDGITQIGGYELHDLVQLGDMSFGMIIGIQSGAFEVLKGNPVKPEVALVNLRDIKLKLHRRSNVTRDRDGNQLSVKNLVKILDGPCRGKQGHVEHIHRGILFIHDQRHLEHAGFMCTKSESCALVGGSRAKPVSLQPRFPKFGAPFRPINSGGFGNQGGRKHDQLVGSTVKIRQGNYKGCNGIVKEVKGNSVRVELESEMRTVIVNRDQITNNASVWSSTLGSEAPVHPSRTPLRPCMTPMRDYGEVPATPFHDGMRTPMRDRAWNPFTPLTPAREDNRSWGSSSSQYQPGNSHSRTYEAPGTPLHGQTPRNSFPARANNAPSPLYRRSTPPERLPPMAPRNRGSKMTPPVVG